MKATEVVTLTPYGRETDIRITLTSEEASLLLQVLDFARMDDDDKNPCVIFADDLYAELIQTVES